MFDALPPLNASSASTSVPTELRSAGSTLFHSLANPLKHEPCRLLGNAKRPRQFVRRNPILAVRQHPDRNHPLIKAKGRIFHDRLNLDGELLLAGIAEPQAASLDEREVLSAAPRAVNLAVREPQLDRVLESPFRIAEVRNRLLQSLWFVHHAKTIYHIHMCVKYIRTR